MSALTQPTEIKTFIKGNSTKYVKLNVGGSLFTTTIGTLIKYDSMLRAMFSGRMEVLTDSEGWVLIDRCGKHFGVILSFLRDGSTALPESKRDLLEILKEAKYYLLQDLIILLEVELKSNQGMEPICRVPLITSLKEEQQLISSTDKPIIKLLCNRHNNKYSYTGQSDDNFLKNIELFDKLALRFSQRIQFIKDIIGCQEVCCWSFFGHNAKISEVCCTSIVYGTDKKHTKVEFPEARIYEETLNILLYESRDSRPDAELLRATTSHRKVFDSDEDLDERIERGDRPSNSRRK